jgi:hypothetical protein
MKTYTPIATTNEAEDIQFSELCPECGANRTALKEMMAETTANDGCTRWETDNRTMAKHIISGCESCSDWWRIITRKVTANA